MRHVGLEPTRNPANPAEKRQIAQAGGAKASLAVFPTLPVDADLRALMKAWPAMPEPIKAGILAMVKAASGAHCKG